MEKTKVCSKCGEEKPLIGEYWQKRKEAKDGFRNQCKECLEKRKKEYYTKNIEHIKEYRKQNAEAIREYNKVYIKEYWSKNADHLKLKQKEYSAKNSETINEYIKKYRTENAKAIKLQIKGYRQKNIEAIKRKRREYEKNKRQNDIGYKILKNCRRRITSAVKGDTKSARTRELIGCSEENLIRHLESQFKEGMTWENYGRWWHIDHIMPCASFNLEKEEQQRKCFHYTNLQPLWADENISKSDKIIQTASIH